MIYMRLALSLFPYCPLVLCVLTYYPDASEILSSDQTFVLSCLVCRCIFNELVTPQLSLCIPQFVPRCSSSLEAAALRCWCPLDGVTGHQAAEGSL